VSAAEILREAAALMRSRAEAASKGPWTAVDAANATAIWREGSANPGWPLVFDPELTMEDAEHIASWHPAVALAVANWLEATADEVDMLGGFSDADAAGLTFARAYLGRPS